MTAYFYAEPLGKRYLMQSTEQNKLCFTIRMLSTIKAATPLTNNLKQCQTGIGN